jgi:hypothetical protein
MMSNSGVLLLIVMILGVVGAIAIGLYFYPLYQAIREKRTRHVVLLLMIPLLLLTVFVVYVWRESQNEIQGMFGVDAKLENKLFSQSSGGWAPDGCTIAMFELPSEIESRYRISPEVALAYVPQNSSFGGAGIMEPWRATPMPVSQHDYLEFVTSPGWWTDTSEVLRVIGDLKQVLLEPGGYFCLRRVGDTNNVYAVDLYVVDLGHKRLYHARGEI